MKTKYLLLFLLVGLPCLAWALADWATSAVDERVSAQAPVPLTEVDMSRLIAASQGASKEQLAKLAGTKIVMGKDVSGLYMVMRMDMARIAPEIDFTKPDDRTAFYTGMIGSMVADEHGVLLDHSPFAVAGYSGVDFKYNGLHQVSKKMVVKHARALLVDRVCYAMLFLSSDLKDSTGTSGNQERTRFFQSLAVKPVASLKK